MFSLLQDLNINKNKFIHNGLKSEINKFRFCLKSILVCSTKNDSNEERLCNSACKKFKRIQRLIFLSVNK